MARASSKADYTMEPARERLLDSGVLEGGVTPFCKSSLEQRPKVTTHARSSAHHKRQHDGGQIGKQIERTSIWEVPS